MIKRLKSCIGDLAGRDSLGRADEFRTDAESRKIALSPRWPAFICRCRNRRCSSLRREHQEPRRQSCSWWKSSAGTSATRWPNSVARTVAIACHFSWLFTGRLRRIAISRWPAPEESAWSAPTSRKRNAGPRRTEGNDDHRPTVSSMRPRPSSACRPAVRARRFASPPWTTRKSPWRK